MRRRKGDRMKTLLRLFLMTAIFIVSFYATTLMMSFLYPLDAAMLAF